MKHLFLTLTLTFFFILPTNAANIRVYCQTQSWWSTDNAATGIHYWGNGITATTWPGVRMTRVESSSDIWYFDIDSKANFVFTRINGSGNPTDWNAKTADLTLPTDGKNMYIIGSTAKWGAACSGSWSTYKHDTVPIGASNLLVLGTFNNWTSTHYMRPDATQASLFRDTIHLEAGREYAFKIRNVNSDKWFGNEGIMTQAHHSDWGFDAQQQSNCRLATSVEGDYIFLWNQSSSQLSVTYPTNDHQATLYPSPIHENNPDVMIQAFYWAHVGSTSEEFTTFGDVKWAKLNEEADTLAKYFDMVWLAPSQETADYMGYLPINYSKQGCISTTDGHSPWGTSADLRTLIDHLHDAGAKVIADIVINHSTTHTDEKYSWCEWGSFDFGQYGVFNPDYTWLAKGDEMFFAQKSKAGECGKLDNTNNEEDEWTYTYRGGTSYWVESEFNCAYSRDWAHKKQEVREMTRAYLTWMRDSMKYDGWRYDFVKGFHGSHIFDYNRSSAPYFSVAEVFDGDIDKQTGVLSDTKNYTYMFDFPGKFTIYNQAIREYKLENLKGNQYTMIGKDENKKYAVTFIDNHDSFREEGKSMHYKANTIDDRQAQQAICYLFSMPGVPCLVYPYWNNYKELVKAVIVARKAVGVHAQSKVESDWAACDNPNDRDNNTYYTAKIKGTNGYLFLKLGKKCKPLSEPESGYRLAWGSNEAAVWYKQDHPTSLPTTHHPSPLTNHQSKILKDGRLYISHDGQLFTILGQPL